MKLNEFQSHMVSLNKRWPNLFVNHNYIRNKNEITWPNRMRFDNDTTTDLLAISIEHRQYSMQVIEDGSIFQFYYSFNNSKKVLSEASIGFIFAGRSIDPIGDPFSEGVMPISSPEILPSWIRLDFDPEAGRDCLHYHSHLHMSIGSDVRIPVKRIPTPKQFVEMIVSWFYPEIYRTKRLLNGEFQLTKEDTQILFEENILVQDGIPQLTGIHISMP